MNDIEKYVQSQLFSMQDLKYKEFHSKLMPTVEKDTIIGVRTPELRRFSKEFSKQPEAGEFMKILPHSYYEENNLHGFLIEAIKDYDKVIFELERFLPYVDNWATCDLMRPKVFKKNLLKLLEQIKIWTKSEHTYTIRFGIEMLMTFYLDENFSPEYLEIAAGVESEEYYVNMMIAWYFATALAKQYNSALPYIEERRLPMWVHNKAIQKSVESYRIAPEQKEYLKTLKIK